MPTYRNDNGNKINMLGLNVSAGDSVESNYYASKNSEVIIGTNEPPGTIIKTFEQALSDGDITKTSDFPSWLLIDTTISSAGTFSDWVYIKATKDIDITIDVTSDFDGTISLQRKYKDNEDPVNVETFTDNTDVGSYFTVSTSAYYRVGIESGNLTSGSATIRVGN